MSAEVTVRAAVIAALRQDAVLMKRMNGLYDGAPERATGPYAVVGECLGVPWGAKDVDGAELRLSISLHDEAETPARLAPLLGRIGTLLAGMAEGGVGWRIVGARLLRSRIARQAGRGERGWRAIMDYRIRVVHDA